METYLRETKKLHVLWFRLLVVYRDFGTLETIVRPIVGWGSILHITSELICQIAIYNIMKMYDIVLSCYNCYYVYDESFFKLLSISTYVNIQIFISVV